ncbi:MAG: prephenate dehydrogenase [Euryarchaeota archaeon]|nr:prephenate dehydrogenase [Euryarchaeota archaeon]
MRIAVIGGTRGLGNWIAEFLKNRGFDVVVTGRDKGTGEKVSKKLGIEYTHDNTKAASKAHVVIISVPIDVTSSVIKEVAPFMREGSLLVDVTSVKEKPTEVMHTCVPPGVEVLPTHPMFSPRIRSLDGQLVVMTPFKEGNWHKKVYEFLKKENAIVLVTTPQLHDQMMSIVQGLTHFAYIGIATTIKKLQVDVKESRKFASPIYGLMLDIIARIVAQNPYLCYSIQKENRYIEKTHETFLSTYRDLSDMISNSEEEKFVRTMSSAAKHLDDLEAALGRSDKAISTLTEEIRILKDAIGEEVGLRHIYSGKIHVGILQDLSPDTVSLNSSNKKIELKLSNVEVLSSDELLGWKIKNCQQRTYDVSVVFPENCVPEIISDSIKILTDVVEAEVLDVYKGRQIPSGKKSITIRYTLINPDCRYQVENLLKGFGGIIR